MTGADVGNAGAVDSALYLGKVMHKRLRPKTHEFDYGCFWFWLDIAKLDDISKRLRWFSLNRFNLFSLYERDFGDRSSAPLRPRIERALQEAGVLAEPGTIYLLTMPRILSYAFNPLSIYFCHDSSGKLAALLWEVSNTFGQRHSYLIPVAEDAEVIEQSCEKNFHVSPFIGMDMHYDFRVTRQDGRLGIAINVSDADGLLLVTALNGRPQDLTNAALLRAFVALPLVTLKVIVSIHWEALKLWLKGAKFRRSPPKPIEALSVSSVQNSSHKDSLNDA